MGYALATDDVFLQVDDDGVLVKCEKCGAQVGSMYDGVTVADLVGYVVGIEHECEAE